MEFIKFIYMFNIRLDTIVVSDMFEMCILSNWYLYKIIVYIHTKYLWRNIKLYMCNQIKLYSILPYVPSY